MQKKVEQLLERVAKEYNLPVPVVKAIYESQAAKTREDMKKGEKGKIETFLNIRWPGFGTFVVKPYKLMIIHRNGNKTES